MCMESDEMALNNIHPHDTIVSMVHPSRIYELNSLPEGKGPVLCWMSRDQRARDNWALLFAALRAAEKGSQVCAAFCLSPGYPGATMRHYDFMFRGLVELEYDLKKSGIPFTALLGDPQTVIPAFAESISAGLIVTDFDPLKIKRTWRAAVASEVNVRCVEIDAHNIVPCRIVSQKTEYGAYTIRPKIHRLLHEYLHPFPEIRSVRQDSDFAVNDWNRIRAGITADQTVPPVSGVVPGEKAAMDALDDFIMNRLERYHKEANDPNKDSVSGLSPYLHFGHISAQRVALAVRESDAPQQAKDAFLEELVVRRELSDNFCLNNSRYDSFDGFPPWARQTLEIHRGDPREHLYSIEELENSLTHDDLWNAAQRQMVRTGYMHGYMRMYWAKKLLEWTDSPETSLEYGLYLNDRYELDGRDPNGYAGLAWSIGGVHDRAWPERKIFGKVRYMNEKGCARKFDVRAYIDRYR